jgi:hypothetical protein
VRRARTFHGSRQICVQTRKRGARCRRPRNCAWSGAVGRVEGGPWRGQQNPAVGGSGVLPISALRAAGGALGDRGCRRTRSRPVSRVRRPRGSAFALTPSIIFWMGHISAQKGGQLSKGWGASGVHRLRGRTLMGERPLSLFSYRYRSRVVARPTCRRWLRLTAKGERAAYSESQ